MRVLKKYIFIALMAIALVTNAEDRFYIEDFSIGAGESKEIAMILENDSALTAFQTDIYLPEGLSVYQDDGEYIFDVSSRTTYRKHTITADTLPGGDGVIRLMCYSTNLNTFSGNSGDLIYFTVVASDDFSGTHKIELKNTLFSDINSVGYVFPNSETNVEEEKVYIVGDANGDGTVTVSDIVMVANNIMGITSNTFIFEAADVNSDGTVSVTDIVMLSNIIMNNVS